MQEIKAKNLATKISDIDHKKGIVSGYLAAFDIMDSDGEVFERGAFKKSLQELGPQSLGNRKITHLYNHVWSEPIGRFLELEEDSFGLKFVTQMGRSQKAQDTLKNYEDGILREHSVGFFYKKEGTHYKSSQQGEYTLLNDVDLLEGSTVTFGANSMTPLVEIKSEKGLNDHLATLEKEMNDLIDIVKAGKSDEEGLFRIEMGMKSLATKYRHVCESYKAGQEQVTKSTLDIAKSESNFNAISALSIYLKNNTN